MPGPENGRGFDLASERPLIATQCRQLQVIALLEISLWYAERELPVLA